MPPLGFKPQEVQDQRFLGCYGQSTQCQLWPSSQLAFVDWMKGSLTNFMNIEHILLLKGIKCPCNKRSMYYFWIIKRFELLVFHSFFGRRQQHPTPVLLPGKSHGWRSLQSGCSPWGRWVGRDWVTSLSLFTFLHWRRKWQPTPVFLPGESQGQRSLVGCHLWGRTELNKTEAT